MKWVKKGLIYAPPGTSLTHASIPVAQILENNLMRIYFSSRDDKGRSNIYYLETNPDFPEQVIKIIEKPILSFGKLGTFDDNGLMPSCLVKKDDRYFLYYIGWNPQVTVTYRLSIGLAVSDGGKVFSRFSKGPLLDRGINEPYFNTAPCVRFENGKWRMWFVSCTGWEIVNDRPEPQYYIRYAESNDGINWRKNDKPCIDYSHKNEAIARPWVFKHDDKFIMLYSYRNIKNYRTDSMYSYRIGLATSLNGIDWDRHDDYSGIVCSDVGWDSQMICYPMVYKHNDKTILLYNGNGFGKTGFGYAVLEN